MMAVMVAVMVTAIMVTKVHSILRSHQAHPSCWHQW
jgi:hypothetical protein